jgi:signal transduction histidine kinase
MSGASHHLTHGSTDSSTESSIASSTDRSIDPGMLAATHIQSLDDRHPAESESRLTNLMIVQNVAAVAPDVQHRLNQAGYWISGVATSATEALHQASQAVPDVVLVDLQLRSDLDGVETATELWENFGVPIVYLTDESDPEAWQRARHTQPYGILFKPLNPGDLLTTISNALLHHQRTQDCRSELAERQAQVEIKSRLVAIVAHEFRNPLNTILFSTELLQRYPDQVSEDKRETYFQRINQSVQRMNQLLDDVLLIGATESGKISFHPLPVNLIAFCHELVQEFQPYKQDVVDFVHEASVDPLVVVDEKLIRHIITNLISNAIKYSPQGSLTEFHLTLNPHNAVFQIRDQGIGIPAVDQAKLFTAFHRGSNVRRIPGTGLGLSIVKQCVELHQGSITFTSEPGHGSSFTVTIPYSTLI